MFRDGFQGPGGGFPYVDNVLGDLPGFIDFQHVRPLSDHREQRQASTEAAHTTRSGQTLRDHDSEALSERGGPTW